MYNTVQNWLAILCIGIVIMPNIAYVHPGETDAIGGHYDTKTGVYHNHNSDRRYRPRVVNSSAEEAIIDARRDAEINTNIAGWAVGGFLCGVFGVGFAYLYKPEVPVHRLMGKSSEYVSVYIVEYQEASRREQLPPALAGFAVWVLLFLYLGGTGYFDN